MGWNVAENVLRQNKPAQQNNKADSGSPTVFSCPFGNLEMKIKPLFCFFLPYTWRISTKRAAGKSGNDVQHTHRNGKQSRREKNLPSCDRRRIDQQVGRHRDTIYVSIYMSSGSSAERLKHDRLVLRLVDNVRCEALQKLGILPLVNRSEDRSWSPTTWIH